MDRGLHPIINETAQEMVKRKIGVEASQATALFLVADALLKIADAIEKNGAKRDE